jgi:hypothetical protein
MRTLAWSVFFFKRSRPYCLHLPFVDASGWLARIGDEVYFCKIEVQWTWSLGADLVYHWKGIEKDSDQKNFGTSMESLKECYPRFNK